MRAAHNPYEFYSYDGVYGQVAPTRYFLRSHFEDVAIQPTVFADMQILDESDAPSTGVVVGSLMVTDLAAGVVEVDEDFLKITGSGANNQSGVYSVPPIPNVAGTIFRWQFTKAAGSNSTVFMNLRAIPGLGAAASDGWRLANVSLSVKKDGAFEASTVITDGVKYTVEMVSLGMGNGFEWWVQGGTQWPKRTMISSGGTSNLTDHYMGTQNTKVAVKMQFNEIAIIKDSFINQWLLPLNLDLTATVGDDAVSVDTTITAEVFDATLGKKLETVTGPFVQGMRWTGMKFVNTVSNVDSSKLTPSKLGIDGNEIMLVHPAWVNATIYAAGAYAVDFVGVQAKYYSTVAGGTSNGTGVADDIGVTWVLEGNYSNMGGGWLTHVRHEPAGTNKITCVKANPTATTNITGSGDPARIFSVVDDIAELTAAGLIDVCSSGKVYKLDNSAGVADANANISGAVGNLNKHTISTYGRSLLGTALIRLGGAVGITLIPTGGYTRVVSDDLTPALDTHGMFVVCPAGETAYFILPGLEESNVVTSVIIGGDTLAAQARLATDFKVSNPLPVNNFQMRMRYVHRGDVSVNNQFWLMQDSGVGWKLYHLTGDIAIQGPSSLPVTLVDGGVYYIGFTRSVALGLTLAVDGVLSATIATSPDLNMGDTLNVGDRAVGGHTITGGITDSQIYTGGDVNWYKDIGWAAP